MQRRIAIVGSGVAGLVAAYKLHASGQQITLYEADFRLGGHAHTVTVIDQDRELALDTGFIVFNEATYPRFTELLQELGIRSQMSIRCQLPAVSVGIQQPGHFWSFCPRGADFETKHVPDGS